MKRAAILALALGGLLCAAAAGAQELGRLFFTPEERAALDERRRARLPDKPVAVPVAPTSRVDGYVQRAGGRSTLWLDGEAVRDGARSGELSVRGGGDPSRVTVILGEGRRVQVRVGETIDRESGEVRDVIGDGEVSVEPRRGR